VSIAQNGNGDPIKVTLLHVLPQNPSRRDKVRGSQIIEEAMVGNVSEKIETRFIEGTNLVDSILEESGKYDLMVLGATEEPLFKNLIIGSTPEQIARRANITVIMVKRRSRRLHNLVRQTVLEPTRKEEIEG
jgi:nucleotide-binding universal stress UspA family protein